MNELIKIKCPSCNSVLAVKKIPRLEKKTITCPVCKYKNPFQSFNTLSPEGEISPETQMEERDFNTSINIKCPSCGTVKVERMWPGIEHDTIMCPVCHHSAPFNKYNHYDIGDINISPETEMVELKFIPHNCRSDSFPYKGTYKSFITPQAIIPNIIPKPYVFPMMHFSKFLEKLTHLLHLYAKKVVYYDDFDDTTAYYYPSELSIAFYDKNYNVYEKLSVKGDYRGNIRCDIDGIDIVTFPDFLEKEIRRLVPQIDKYIIGPDYVSPDNDDFTTYRSFNIKPLEIKKMIDQYVEEREYLSREPTLYGPPPIDNSKDWSN